MFSIDNASASAPLVGQKCTARTQRGVVFLFGLLVTKIIYSSWVRRRILSRYDHARCAVGLAELIQKNESIDEIA